MKNKRFVIGIDYGTDSARALIVDASDGLEVSTAVHNYSRWAHGEFCTPSENVFRQHPLDYIEALVSTVKAALRKAPKNVSENIAGIAIDTTGSTPAPTDQNGTPLAMHDKFKNDPDAMFILWKDHSSVDEAAEINDFAHSGKFEDYTKYCGGTYSSEWFWSKILHTIRKNKKIAESAFSWVEHCDWMTALLTGCNDAVKIKRSRCAAGHKAMWHKEFGGLPSEDFLKSLHPLLAQYRQRLYTDTYCSDIPAGTLTKDWAQKLGIKSSNVVVAVGAFDAHMGAVGGAIKPGSLLKIVGTSTCDMLVTPMPEKEKLIRGICGQVDGSIIPGMLGLEAGQSAFGDFYAWFRSILLWTARSTDAKFAKNISAIKDAVIPALTREAEKISPADTPIFTDWINGRRTPFADQTLKASAIGFEIGTSAPAIFRAIVEATAFGSRKINECFTSQGLEIKKIIALGGIPKKSPFVMQILADVLGMPVQVVRSEQACALGAAMFAATAAGIYKKVEQAQNAMNSGFEKTYTPDKKLHKIYNEKYQKYLQLCQLAEKELKI